MREKFTLIQKEMVILILFEGLISVGHPQVPMGLGERTDGVRNIRSVRNFILSSS